MGRTGFTPPRSGAARGAMGTRAARPAAAASRVLRSLVVAIAMFVVAALAGVLLSGAAPAHRAGQPEPGPPGDQPDIAAEAGSGRAPDEDNTEDIARFGHSLVVSGAAALAVSVAGMVLVGRRRRLW